MHHDARRFHSTPVNGTSIPPAPRSGKFANPSLEALLEEQRRLWRAGTPIPAAEYLAQQPALRAAAEDAATVIYQEFVLRQQHGETVDLAEYIDRFADYESELRQLHEADQFVNQLFAAPALPKRVGDYELLEELGRGGMGIVYRARHQGLQRIVALKMLLAGELAATADIDRFGNEARAPAQLQHPGIVAIHNVGEHEGRHFFTMDFVEGQSLATAGEDATIRIWDGDEYRPALALKGHLGTIFAAAFSPDGSRLATAGKDGIRLWDTTRGRELFTVGDRKVVSGIAFSPDGRQLASASWDSTVSVWNSADGQELRTLRAHTDSAWRVAYSAHGERLASVANDGTVRIWDVARGEVLHTLRGGHSAHVSGVAFSPDGVRVASAGLDGTVRVWDALRGEELLTLKSQTKRAFAVAFSPDGHRLVATTQTGALQIWDATPRVP